MCACTHTHIHFSIFLLINTYGLCYIEDKYEESYCDKCSGVGERGGLSELGVSGGVSSQREYVETGVGEEGGGRCDLGVNWTGFNFKRLHHLYSIVTHRIKQETGSC